MKNFNTNNKIWLNGEFVSYEDAKIHFLSNGLHYAGIIFEGEKVYNKKIFKMKEHRERFVKSANALGINLPYSIEQLNEATETLLNQSGLSYAYIRMVALVNSVGDITVGINEPSTHIAIAVYSTEKYFQSQNGISLFISNWQRPSPLCVPTDIKASGMYMMSNIYKKEAIQNGYNDSILCDFENNIADTTCSNIFFIKDNEIYTPKAKHFLHGITRNTLIQEMQNRNIPVHQVQIKKEDISNFDSAFITGTAVEVTPIIKIGTKHLVESKITLMAQNIYKDIVHNS